MTSTAGSETAASLLAFESAFDPHAVESPLIVYPRRASPWLTYPHRNEEHFVRASFDRWDALRACRGEYLPYALSGGWSSLRVVENSRWLKERYAYERQHYGNAYGFGGDVNEMLEEFEHYLFLFHDEFVEVIAGGVCFETSNTPFDWNTPFSRIGLDELPDAFTVEQFEVHGIRVQLRKDPRSAAEILAASRLCDQSLYQAAFDVDGVLRVTHHLTVRSRHGETKSRWRSAGRVEATFNGLVEDPRPLRPLVARHAVELAERRRQLGIA